MLQKCFPEGVTIREGWGPLVLKPSKNARSCTADAYGRFRKMLLAAGETVGDRIATAQEQFTHRSV
jgi:hypothetical protein